MQPEDLISRQYIVDTTDGRQIVGILLALDDQGNLLLTNTTEQTPHMRELGLISVRKQSISKISLSKNDYNSMFK